MHFFVFVAKQACTRDICSDSLGAEARRGQSFWRRVPGLIGCGRTTDGEPAANTLTPRLKTAGVVDHKQRGGRCNVSLQCSMELVRYIPDVFGAGRFQRAFRLTTAKT